MTELLTAARMRAVEGAAMASGAVTGLALMERAGAGVVDAVVAEWPELGTGGHSAVVLCGPGNNGGDGFVVAHELAKAGWKVKVFLYGDPERLPPDARANYDRWCGMGQVHIRAIDPPPLADDSFATPDDVDLLVDALFGTGLGRPFGGLFAVLAETRVQDILRQKGVKRIAVDIPTGLCSDSGRILGKAIPADLTVTFHRARPGHFLADGPAVCGKLVIRDIGLGPFSDLKNPRRRHKIPDPAHITRATLAALTKGAGNKFDHGHALVLTGGPGRTGAARLAARGALRIGAGLVTLGVPPAAQLDVAGQITALMLVRVPDADRLNEVLKDFRINALCLGPGLGLGDHAAALVDAVLGAQHSGPARRVVFDADALTLIAQDPARTEALNAHTVLTPHGGEFARLFPDISEKLAAVPDTGPAYSRVDATREAAARCGAVVLFKGADTVIAHPDGRASIHAAAYERAAPWLATAGAGDVLAGFITGLLARGVAPMQAAETATWLHVECARAFGPGLIAEDLPEMLPQVLRELGPQAGIDAMLIAGTDSSRPSA